MAEVFSYLTHTEKLISRLVCTGWNRGISPILAKASYFTLTTATNHEVILDSEVPWTKIKTSDSPGYGLPTKTRSLITTIKLEVSGPDRKESVRILSRFPNLVDLELNILGEHFTKREVSGLTREQFQVLLIQFKERAEKLKNLTITFPFGKFSTLSKFLTGLFSRVTSLVNLSLREQRSSLSELVNEGNSQKCSMTAVSNTISSASLALKHLELQFVSKIRKKLFTELIPKLSALEALKLESLLIHLDPIPKILETDFQIHQHFLKAQIAKGFLRRLNLPSCSNVSLCQEFLQSVPDNTKFVGNVCEEHTSDEFYSTFSKCETMTLHSRNSSMFTHPCPSIRQFHYCIIDDEDDGDFTRQEYIEFYKNLGNSLIHLVEFYTVRCDRSTFSEHDLQLVIENFQQLRVLEIHFGGRVLSDYGVCGIEEKYAEGLKKTNKLYLNPIIPDENRDGRILCSLKYLEKLVLLGTSITDLGIYYGLRFGSTLKHMTYETDEKISDWGLYWLGAGNPGLESFHCSFITGKISSDGPENLRKQFPMLESTGKFKLVVKKP